MSELSVTIFTPTHDCKYLFETYQSIKDQPYNHWVIYPNMGRTKVDISQEILTDSRTVIIESPNGIWPPWNYLTNPGIGAIKKFLCSQCTDNILVELDHDDLLVNDAILKIREAFEDPKVVFAYSNCAEFNNDETKSIRMFGNVNPTTNYDEVNGWQYRDYVYEGNLYKEAICPEVTPYHTSLLLWAPNHFRAFRKEIYDKVGGHDETFYIADDADLMCRLYLEGEFKHIDSCCYLYRVHGENSWLKYNADIQTKMVEVQKKYIHSMAEVWAKRNGLRCLDLGGRFGSPEGYESVDLKDVDIITNLNECWPFDDSSIGIIRAYDILEHLKNPVFSMSEIHRVLVPGGYFFGLTPSTDGRGAWMDPSHISFFNQNSFWYYTRRESAKYIDNTSIRFQEIVLETTYPNDWALENNIPYVRSDLIALKEGGSKIMGQKAI